MLVVVHKKEKGHKNTQAQTDECAHQPILKGNAVGKKNGC